MAKFGLDIQPDVMVIRILSRLFHYLRQEINLWFSLNSQKNNEYLLFNYKVVFLCYDTYFYTPRANARSGTATERGPCGLTEHAKHRSIKSGSSHEPGPPGDGSIAFHQPCARPEGAQSQYSSLPFR